MESQKVFTNILPHKNCHDQDSGSRGENLSSGRLGLRIDFFGNRLYLFALH